MNDIFHKMHISKISRIPKTIWGIIAAISTAVFGFLLLPSVWFWICWEVVAGVLVAIGCFGEWYLLKTPATPGGEDHHRSKELQFIFVVAIGVTMELCGLAHTIPEAMRLEKDIALANERVSSNELARVGLEKRIVELKLKVQARLITPTQITNFIFLTEKIPKIPIRVQIGAFRDETVNYAAQIRHMFTEAGFKVPVSDAGGLYGIHGNPNVGFTWLGTEGEWPDVVIFTDITNLADLKFPVERANGLPRPVLDASDTNIYRIHVAIEFALLHIGFRLAVPAYDPGTVATQHCAFHVVQRP